MILCYLLLNLRHPMHRDQIATTFWGDYPTQAARKYLRNALWRLKQSLEEAGSALDEYLLITEDSVSFVSTSEYDLDVEYFENAVGRCRDAAGQDLDDEQAEQLEKAARLYAGDLLEGTYEDWCLYDRERLSLLFMNALTKLMAYHEKRGRFEHSLAYGERILSRDNTREKVHFQMMRLYWLSGDRHAALAQYRRCAQILREELNISPMKETTEAYQQMLVNQYHPELSKSGSQDAPSPVVAAPINETILARLEHLQSIIEETRLEVQQIELLLQKGLLGTKL